MDEKLKMIEMAIDNILQIDVKLINRLIMEFETLSIDQIQLLGDITFPISDEEREVLNFIPEDTLKNIEKLITIYKSIQSAKEEGRYETSEHYLGIALL